jgi:hypothetical protein
MRAGPEVVSTIAGCLILVPCWRYFTMLGRFGRRTRAECVLEAMKNRGYNFSNFRTLQRRFDRLLEEHKKSACERATVSGVEDVEEDPLQMLLEDIANEIQDHQAEKAQKKKLRRKARRLHLLLVENNFVIVLLSR